MGYWNSLAFGFWGFWFFCFLDFGIFAFAGDLGVSSQLLCLGAARLASRQRGCWAAGLLPQGTKHSLRAAKASVPARRNFQALGSKFNIAGRHSEATATAGTRCPSTEAWTSTDFATLKLGRPPGPAKTQGCNICQSASLSAWPNRPSFGCGFRASASNVEFAPQCLEIPTSGHTLRRGGATGVVGYWDLGVEGQRPSSPAVGWPALLRPDTADGRGRSPKFQKSKNPKFQKSKVPKIQKSKNPKFQKPKNPNFGNLHWPSAGGLEVQFPKFGFLDFWKFPKFGFLDFWKFPKFGFLDFWIFGFLDFWIFGSGGGFERSPRV